MLILLPPSEGKSGDGRRGRPVDLSTLWLPELADSRRHLLDALVDLCTAVPLDPGPSTDSLPGSSAERVALAALGLTAGQRGELRRDAALWSAAARPAAEVYTGVLYEALDIPTLPAAAKARLFRAAVIFSGLWGAVRPGDRIPPYRCGVGASLPGVGGLGTYWRRVLPAAIGPRAGDQLVLDLRSGPYAAMWTPDGAATARTAVVRVLHERTTGGVIRRTVVSHFNKATKGRLVRDLVLAGAVPKTPAKLVAALRDLKYQVEAVPGTPWRLDVIVSEL